MLSRYDHGLHQPHFILTINTESLYDFYTNVHFTLKQNPLTDEDLEDFIACYQPENRFERTWTWSLENPDDRWSCFNVEKDILPRDKTSLDIFWIKDKSITDLDNLPLPMSASRISLKILKAQLK